MKEQNTIIGQSLLPKSVSLEECVHQIERALDKEGRSEIELNNEYPPIEKFQILCLVGEVLKVMGWEVEGKTHQFRWKDQGKAHSGTVSALCLDDGTVFSLKGIKGWKDLHEETEKIFNIEDIKWKEVSRSSLDIHTLSQHQKLVERVASILIAQRIEAQTQASKASPRVKSRL